jgi:hypothetical protein
MSARAKKVGYQSPPFAKGGMLGHVRGGKSKISSGEILQNAVARVIYGGTTSLSAMTASEGSQNENFILKREIQMLRQQVEQTKNTANEAALMSDSIDLTPDQYDELMKRSEIPKPSEALRKLMLTSNEWDFI